jgi:nucleotide-binding universal stress UspA family protein
VTLFSNGGGKPARSADRRVFLKRRAILVATSLDESGVVALRRAHALSKVFSARLHLMHVLPSSTRPLVVDEEVARDAVVRWAADQASVVLSGTAVHVDIGDPTAAIGRAAKLFGAELVVVGAPETEAAAEAVLSLAGALSHVSALLVAHPPKTSGELVAATDLRDEHFPIVKTAAHLADALAARVTVVHNLENDGPVLALALENIAGRLQELERLANELDRIRGGRVSTTRTTAEAIADVAHARDADIAVVGIRRGHGRTLLSLLGRATCSVLAIPLP